MSVEHDAKHAANGRPGDLGDMPVGPRKAWATPRVVLSELKGGTGLPGTPYPTDTTLTGSTVVGS